MNRKAHGSLMSYVIGFELSAAFTLIPYLLVVNHSFSGTALLATILGFAIAQMFIQIVFFLHLGRGPKPLYNVAFFVATAGMILIIIVGSLFIMSHLHYNMTPTQASTQLAEGEGVYQVEGNKTGACQQIYTNHQVVISNGQVNPLHTKAHLCDRLTITNQDNQWRNMAFGEHIHHQAYDGVTEKVLKKGESLTVVLNQTGSFTFHDHLEDAVSGDFTVAQ